MKRKLLSLALALCLVLSLAGTAYADVIWEPWDDDFYEAHRAEFQIVNECCYVNGAQGGAWALDRPDGKAVTWLKNGEIFWAYYVWTAGDGVQWAVASQQLGDEWVSAYVPMADLLNRYDHEFLDDHAGEITDVRPQGLTLPDTPPAVFLTWTYPHGVYETMEADWQGMAESCVSFYTDGEGAIWGYVGYWCGVRDVWLCLTDPNNPDLAQPELYTGTVYEAAEELPQPEKDQTINPWYVVLPLCALVLAVIVILWPRKKKRPQEA